MPQSPAILLTMIKLSNPLRGGNALMNRLRSAAAGARSGFRSAGNSVRAAVTPRSPTVMDRVRRGAGAVSGAALPLAALGAAGAGAAGLYSSGMGGDMYDAASQGMQNAFNPEAGGIQIPENVNQAIQNVRGIQLPNTIGDAVDSAGGALSRGYENIRNRFQE